MTHPLPRGGTDLMTRIKYDWEQEPTRYPRGGTDLMTRIKYG